MDCEIVTELLQNRFAARAGYKAVEREPPEKTGVERPFTGSPH